MTRAEKIRQMDDAKLAGMLCDLIWEAAGCSGCRFNTAVGCKVREWIEAEVTDEQQDVQ